MRILQWFLYNGIFAAFLYYGLVVGIEGAANIAYFIAWVSGLASFMVYNDEARETLLDRAIPTWLDVSYDLCAVAIFLWYGAIATPIIYFIHILNMHYGYSDD